VNERREEGGQKRGKEITKEGGRMVRKEKG
jgi:hypothetical protein